MNKTEIPNILRKINEIYICYICIVTYLFTYHSIILSHQMSNFLHNNCLLSYLCLLQITDQLEACAWEYCRSCGHEPESVSDLAAHKDKYDGVYDAILNVVEM